MAGAAGAALAAAAGRAAAGGASARSADPTAGLYQPRAGEHAGDDGGAAAVAAAAGAGGTTAGGGAAGFGLGGGAGAGVHQGAAGIPRGLPVRRGRTGQGAAGAGIFGSGGAGEHRADEYGGDHQQRDPAGEKSGGVGVGIRESTRLHAEGGTGSSRQCRGSGEDRGRIAGGRGEAEPGRGDGRGRLIGERLGGDHGSRRVRKGVEESVREATLTRQSESS